MKLVAAILGLATLFAGTAAPAQDRPPVLARAEACLRANVERVVAVESDLQSAATFLVNFACAETTAGAARYERNLGWLASFKGMSSSLPKEFEKSSFSMEVEASVDPETGEFIIPKPKPGERPSPLVTMLPQMSMNAAAMFPDTMPLALRRLAGELVLAARERQKASKR